MFSRYLKLSLSIVCRIVPRGPDTLGCEMISEQLPAQIAVTCATLMTSMLLPEAAPAALEPEHTQAVEAPPGGMCRTSLDCNTREFCDEQRGFLCASCEADVCLQGWDGWEDRCRKYCPSEYYISRHLAYIDYFILAQLLERSVPRPITVYDRYPPGPLHDNRCVKWS